MINVKIIKDSISPHHKRITTFELEYPRFIHAELLTHRALSKNSSSCLAGDTKIYLVENCLHSPETFCNKIISLQELVKLWQEFPEQEFKLQSLNEDTQEFYPTTLTKVFCSGLQEVFSLKLENGYTLRCTAEHQLLTNQGWITLKDLGITPEMINHNWKNQDLSLAMYIPTVNKLHKCRLTNSALTSVYQKLVEITYVGLQETYDLEVSGPYHNFVANGIVVHNSRAQPVKFMIQQIWHHMALPVHWGQQQAGMQAKQELSGWRRWLAQMSWSLAGRLMCIFAWWLLKLRLHKQVANRILEPWSHIKIVLTATELDNFFYLRNHPDAQPEIHELAFQMYQAYVHHQPELLQAGQWHLPYVEHEIDAAGEIKYYIWNQSNKEYLTLIQAQEMSASLCAQVSYRKADYTLTKAHNIYQRLVESKPVHASPFEHQATPLPTATDRSNNFLGWYQYRASIPGNVCLEYQSEE